MADKTHIQVRRQFFALAAVLVPIAAGCQDSEQIRTYSVPKEAKAEVAAAASAAAGPAATQGEPTDRMLTAVVPVDGQAWFFKVVGPIVAIDKHEKELNGFFATIGVAEDGKPTWKLPEGWNDGPAKPMRFATLLMPTDDKPLEIAVSAASWPGTPESVLANVNRWRGQLQLPPTDAEQVSKDMREAKAGDKTITIVDLRGRYTGGMMAPFAGRGPAAPATTPGAPPGLPPGHPPIDAAQESPRTPPAASVAAGVPKFTVPKEWQVLPADGFRKAAFAIGDAEHGAVVTLIDFPATEGPMIADPLTNVNRWRREVGLNEIKADGLSKVTEEIDIDGKPATFVRIVPDASQPEESKSNLATLAAMAKTGDQMWFIKMKGDRTVVTAQVDAFKTFLKSLRFAGGGGATDGNK